MIIDARAVGGGQPYIENGSIVVRSGKVLAVAARSPVETPPQRVSIGEVFRPLV